MGKVINLDKEIKYLSLEDMRNIFKTISKSERKHSLRDLCLFEVAFETGCRASEMGLFTVKDFKHVTRELYCRRLKNGNNNTVRLSKETARHLKKYITEAKLQDEDYIFISQQGGPINRRTIDNLTRSYFKSAKIKDVSKHHFHVVRHTKAVTMLEQGFKLEDVQYVLGHKNIANTSIYAQFSSNYKRSLFDKMDMISVRS